jgi:HPt (histidine-containing phosphotransfer) domain-containing protein
MKSRVSQRVVFAGVAPIRAAAGWLGRLIRHGRNLCRTIPPGRETIRIEMPLGLEQIMPSYLAGRRMEVPELIALLAASDFERIAHLAHNIKGTGTSYGFVVLSRIGAALEVAARRRDPSDAGAQLRDLNDYLGHVHVVAQEGRQPELV